MVINNEFVYAYIILHIFEKQPVVELVCNCRLPTVAVVDMQPTVAALGSKVETRPLVV